MTHAWADTPIEVLHRDDRIVVVAKPSGLMVHRTNISRDRVFLSEILRERLGQRVWTVHRLDRATSGVLVCALDVEAAAILGKQFMAGTVEKRYLAIVRGWIDDEGLIDRPLKHEQRGDQEAMTRFRCLARAEIDEPVAPHPTSRYSLVELRPETGRRHQLRRHLNGLAHPIIGDVNHGDRRHNRLFRMKFASHRLLLHAERLAFEHPATADRLAFHAPLPDDIRRVQTALGWSESSRETGR
ncbi:pseudouridine synthase [Halomonas denitrificans]|nr:pseudouridylate synthase [Halomonas denitrificans]